MSDLNATVEAPQSEALNLPGEYPCGLTWDGKSFWHSDQAAKKIWSLDPTDGHILQEHNCPAVRADLAYDGSMLAQVGKRPKRLVLVDPSSGSWVHDLPINPANGRTTGAEFSPDGLWLLLRNPTVIQLRKYPSMEVVREHAVRMTEPSGLTWCDGVVVVGEFTTGMFHALDAASGRYRAFRRVPGKPTGMTWDGERIWYCDFPSRKARAIEPLG
ncbi:MAG: hypothetical protein AAFX85_00695 [Pseudomonadota bacterium]